MEAIQFDGKDERFILTEEQKALWSFFGEIIFKSNRILTNEEEIEVYNILKSNNKTPEQIARLNALGTLTE